MVNRMKRGSIAQSVRTASRALGSLAAGAAAGLALGKAAQRGKARAAKKTYKRKQKKAPKTRKGKINKLEKQVKSLNKKMSNGEGTLIYYGRDKVQHTTAVNTQTHTKAGYMGIAELENTLAQLRFFDSATPGTLVQASGATGTYARQYMFDVYAKLKCRNNYQVPCAVTVYTVVPKEDTSVEAYTAYTDGLVDIGGVSSTSMMVHITDSKVFNALWKIKEFKRAVLMPGQELDVTHATGKFTYDPSVTDSETQSYQQKYKSWQFIVRVEGTLAHDSSVAGQVGFTAAGVDCCWTVKYTVKYDAGANLTYMYIQDNVSAFTNGALVSSYPVADNIPYSVS